jgi:cardiolipin synthase A/B
MAPATRLLFAALIVVSGCSTLPTFVPDLHDARRPAVQLQGARGALSAAQSKTILDGLRSRGQDGDLFERHLALEEAIVGSPLTTGNEVVLLQDGPATYRAMLEAIAAAGDHINLETYIFDDDEVGRQFAQALIDKQRQGVQVNLIRDSVGTLGSPAEFFERLVAGGVRVLEFNPVNPLAAGADWQVNRRDHRKLLIVDGHTAFLGGINISSVYASGSLRKAPARRPEPGGSAAPAWRDTDLRLRGPVVAELPRVPTLSRIRLTCTPWRCLSISACANWRPTSSSSKM